MEHATRRLTNLREFALDPFVTVLSNSVSLAVGIVEFLFSASDLDTRTNFCFILSFSRFFETTHTKVKH